MLTKEQLDTIQRDMNSVREIVICIDRMISDALQKNALQKREERNCGEEALLVGIIYICNELEGHPGQHIDFKANVAWGTYSPTPPLVRVTKKVTTRQTKKVVTSQKTSTPTPCSDELMVTDPAPVPSMAVCQNRHVSYGDCERTKGHTGAHQTKDKINIWSDDEGTVPERFTLPSCGHSSILDWTCARDKGHTGNHCDTGRSWNEAGEVVA